MQDYGWSSTKGDICGNIGTRRCEVLWKRASRSVDRIIRRCNYSGILTMEGNSAGFLICVAIVYFRSSPRGYL